MHLWTPEIEALRGEARAVVGELLGAMRSTFTDDLPLPTDPVERVARQRALMGRHVTTVPEAVDEEIAGVRCRIIRPERPARAVYLHFHGGGMILGTPEMSDVANLATSRAHDVAVVSVDYRLAPEHPYPAGPDDGVAVAAWLIANGPQRFGTGRLLIGGESAGGYMAAAVLLRIRDELGAARRVIGANLVFGVHDWGRSPSQRGLRPGAGPDLLDPSGIEFFSDCYLPGRTDDERRDPAVSPAFADLRGLPPALLSVGTDDHLLDDSLWLAARYAAAGNETDLFVAPDMPHGFGNFPCGISTAWAARTHGWFADLLARPPSDGVWGVATAPPSAAAGGGT
jgi:acetyl esterase/lipase